MGLMSFLKDAGEKLFPQQQAKAAPQAQQPQVTAADVGRLNREAGDAIERYVQQLGLPVKNLQVSFDGATSTATVSGEVDDQATKEKLLLACGNVQGVASVKDQVTVAGTATAAQAQAQFHTVQSGDTLSKIAAQHYGDANAYMKIFEANRPMLSDPDQIYPGQVLRIPART